MATATTLLTSPPGGLPLRVTYHLPLANSFLISPETKKKATCTPGSVKWWRGKVKSATEPRYNFWRNKEPLQVAIPESASPPVVEAPDTCSDILESHISVVVSESPAEWPLLAAVSHAGNCSSHFIATNPGADPIRRPASAPPSPDEGAGIHGDLGSKSMPAVATGGIDKKRNVCSASEFNYLVIPNTHVQKLPFSQRLRQPNVLRKARPDALLDDTGSDADCDVSDSGPHNKKSAAIRAIDGLALGPYAPSDAPLPFSQGCPPFKVMGPVTPNVPIPPDAPRPVRWAVHNRDTIVVDIEGGLLEEDDACILQPSYGDTMAATAECVCNMLHGRPDEEFHPEPDILQLPSSPKLSASMPLPPQSSTPRHYGTQTNVALMPENDGPAPSQPQNPPIPPKGSFCQDTVDDLAKLPHGALQPGSDRQRTHSLPQPVPEQHVVHGFGPNDYSLMRILTPSVDKYAPTSAPPTPPPRNSQGNENSAIVIPVSPPVFPPRPDPVPVVKPKPKPKPDTKPTPDNKPKPGPKPKPDPKPKPAPKPKSKPKPRDAVDWHEAAEPFQGTGPPYPPHPRPAPSAPAPKPKRANLDPINCITEHEYPCRLNPYLAFPSPPLGPKYSDTLDWSDLTSVAEEEPIDIGTEWPLIPINSPGSWPASGSYWAASSDDEESDAEPHARPDSSPRPLPPPIPPLPTARPSSPHPRPAAPTIPHPLPPTTRRRHSHSPARASAPHLLLPPKGPPGPSPGPSPLPPRPGPPPSKPLPPTPKPKPRPRNSQTAAAAGKARRLWAREGWCA